MAMRETQQAQAIRSGAELGWWLKHGVGGGIVAGIVFIGFELVVAAAMLGADAFVTPLRMIGAIALGRPALDPSYPLMTAALTGLAVHLVLAMLYGALLDQAGALAHIRAARGYRRPGHGAS